MKGCFFTITAVILTLLLILILYFNFIVYRFPPIPDADRLVLESRELILSQEEEKRYRMLMRDEFPPEFLRLEAGAAWLRGNHVVIMLRRQHYVWPVYVVFVDEKPSRSDIEDHWVATDHPSIYRYFQERER